jgi:hypothetical protein
MKLRHASFSLLLLVASNSLTKAQHALHHLWETEAVVRTPESVLFDGNAGVLYVAQIDGKAAEKDGKGGIGKVGLDGNVINLNWVSGLNAPKGMGQLKGKLYVADIDEVVVVDIKSGKVLEKIKVPDASFLNDITVDKKGNVYVSDSNTKKVHRISGGKVSVYHETPTKPNGLLAVGTDLLILDSGTLLKVDAQKKVTTLVTDLDKSTDGIEEVKPGEYIVSCWSGVIYYVKADGSKQELLNTSEQKVNSADIGYDAKKRIVYVPTFFKNSVAAYHLK